MRVAIVCLLSLYLVASVDAQRYGDSTPPPFAQPSGQGSRQTDSPPPLSSSFDGLTTGAGNQPPASTPPPLPASRPFVPERNAAATPPRNQYQPSPPAARTSTGSKTYSPAELMRGMLSRPGDSQLSGQPVMLEEVVASGESRSDQTQRINAYWDLCSSTADYYLGLAEAEELRRLRQQAGAGSAALNEAVAQWRTRIGTSQLAAIAAQRRLASLMGRASLPLPGDMPLCGAYKTRYEQVFATRSSEEASVLDQLIPLRFAELSAAATTVSRSQDFATSVKQRDASGEGMVRALELLALSRRAFVQIAKDYNRQITRYTELSTPGRIDTNRLVAMLVERPRNNSTASQSRPLTFRPGRQ